MKARRLQVGLTQDALAQAIGVSFQQVQKYEKGTNRIAASRLAQIATALSVPVAHFYGDGLVPRSPEPRLSAESLIRLGAIGRTRPEPHEVEAVVAAFGRVPVPAMRQAIVDLIARLADSLAGDGPSGKDAAVDQRRACEGQNNGSV